MRPRMHLQQLRRIRRQIALRSGQTGVAQQLLHLAQAGPVFQQMRGKGVAQRVRCGVRRQAQLLAHLLTCGPGPHRATPRRCSYEP